MGHREEQIDRVQVMKRVGDVIWSWHATPIIPAGDDDDFALNSVIVSHHLDGEALEEVVDNTIEYLKGLDISWPI